jgi:hypothetical protein
LPQWPQERALSIEVRQLGKVSRGSEALRRHVHAEGGIAAMAEELPNVITPVDPGALAVELTAAWRALRVETPARESILILVAHSALETGHWKSCHCHNIGNVKSVPGDGRDWTHFRCYEVEKGKVVWYDPPSPVTRFRAFRTLREGALDHLAFLMSRKRYAAAWQFVLDPDPKEFVRALWDAGYFTAEAEPVAQSVARIFAGYMRTLSFEPAPVDPELDEETKARTMQRVQMCLHELAGQVVDELRHGTTLPPKVV